jgi:hypothetical protein
MPIDIKGEGSSFYSGTSSRLRKHDVLLFLTGLPLWMGILLVVILPTIVAMCGVILLRSWIGHERLSTNNEIAGFKFATVGVIYSVLAVFSVVVVWQKFSDAQVAVEREAGAAAALYRLAAGSEPGMVATREALGKYLRLAIEKDWPRMAVEKESNEATQALDALYTAVVRVAESGSSQRAILIEMFTQLDAITEARRTRLHLATGIVPRVLWLVLACSAVLTVCFTFFFGTRNLRAQVLMTGMLSLMVFMALFIVVSIDHPFTGPSYVGSEALHAVLEDFPH